MNPNQRTYNENLNAAMRGFQNFTGQSAGMIERFLMPEISHAWALGPIEKISYVATRDGETAIYEHKFKESSRPLLVASTDGDQLVIVGGQYQVTERGIVDRSSN